MPLLCPDVAANPRTRCCNNAALLEPAPKRSQPCLAVVQKGISLVIPSTLSCCSGTLTWGLPDLQKALLKAASPAAANYLNSRRVNYKGNSSKVSSDLMQAGKLPPVNIQDTEQKPWQQYWWKIPFPHATNNCYCLVPKWDRDEGTGMTLLRLPTLIIRSQAVAWCQLSTAEAVWEVPGLFIYSSPHNIVDCKPQLCRYLLGA